MNKTKIITSSFKSALFLGLSGFILGYEGPLIFYPNANQGPLLGIFITGPGGFLLGGIIGLIVGIIKQYNETGKPSKILGLIPILWKWTLLSCLALSILIIIVSIFYIPWYEKKYSQIVKNSMDLQKRDKSLASLSVRSLSDDEIGMLQQFNQLKDIDFYVGWGVEEAKLTDLGLKKIAELNLPKLEMLMLGFCKKITDDGMQFVVRIKNLKYLSLAGCEQITDNGLSKLTASTTIENLDLRGCKGITDRGLGYLKQMPNLRQVLLGGCKNVSSTGIDELRQSLPNCKVTKDDQEWAMIIKIM
jgi:hypothetical protein